jgi:hypothetical protein
MAIGIHHGTRRSLSLAGPEASAAHCCDDAFYMHALQQGAMVASRRLGRACEPVQPAAAPLPPNAGCKLHGAGESSSAAAAGAGARSSHGGSIRSKCKRKQQQQAAAAAAAAAAEETSVAADGQLASQKRKQQAALQCLIAEARVAKC